MVLMVNVVLKEFILILEYLAEFLMYFIKLLQAPGYFYPNVVFHETKGTLI
jgi:hypothetical protein